TLTLFALFGVWQATTGSLDIGPIASGSIAPGRADTIFMLALIGFGLKAGLYPLQFWLPSAHAQAPSHVSALLSGVLIKMGVYGVVRFVSLLPDPPLWWGVTILALGGVSGVLGVAFALGQHDLKRLLAYHSIENIGIIFIGIGLALLGRATGRAEWVVLGLGGALLHVWNHGLFKSLLFLAAGSAIRAAHTREIDHLGGLARRMPMTSLAFLIGSAAICGLPPLNGFISELWIFLGLFRAGIARGWESAAPIALIPVLALIGGLALICFVKVFGVVFLGEPRHEHAAAATESPRGMLWPMAPLAGACLWIGVFPATIAPWLDSACGCWLSGSSGAAGTVAELPGGIASLVPLSALTATALLLLLGLAAGWSRLRSSEAG
ncbi:MAG TPA: proton-conducting transporter membrane subunit, partial [Solirubrobacterales bacterium]|nr:proton-conducting transporter membrane subunit [Solirubrobacterales bacterium]